MMRPEIHEPVPFRPAAPTRSQEVSPPLLEHLADALGLSIDLPAPEGGWARIESPSGLRYHAWVPGVGS